MPLLFITQEKLVNTINLTSILEGRSIRRRRPRSIKSRWRELYCQKGVISMRKAKLFTKLRSSRSKRLS